MRRCLSFLAPFLAALHASSALASLPRVFRSSLAPFCRARLLRAEAKGGDRAAPGAKEGRGASSAADAKAEAKHGAGAKHADDDAKPPAPATGEAKGSPGRAALVLDTDQVSQFGVKYPS